MAPFYGWGSTTSSLEPLRGGSLLFSNKLPEVPSTHFIDLGRMKGRAIGGILKQKKIAEELKTGIYYSCFILKDLFADVD